MSFPSELKEKFSSIRPEFFRLNKIVPLSFRDDVLELACSGSSSRNAADNLSSLIKLPVSVRVLDASELEKAMDAFFYSLLPSMDIGGEQKNSNTQDKLVDLSRTEPVLKAVNALFYEAIKARASDIHLRPEESGGALIRMRVDGKLCDIRRVPAELYSGMVSRIKIMSELDISVSRKPQDASMRINLLGRDIDIRVSIVPSAAGPDIVLRVLDRDAFLLDMNGTGLDGEELERVGRILTKTRGMLVVTGPTGSGKTTTMYSFIQELAGRGLNIVTVENPIEYIIEGITQIEVNNASGISFASGLRSILRHDPDVIMVGEIRDPETASTAVQAAMTGHLVLASLHTADTASVPERLYDLGVEPYLVSSCLSGALAQRLVRVFCPECKGGGGNKDCAICSGSGYKGRTGIFEVVESSSEYSALLSERAGAEKIRAFYAESSIRTLAQNAEECVNRGLTSEAEARGAVS